MNLKILLPTRTLVDEPVRQVTAETADGLFTIRPRHVDYVTTLVPGLLAYDPAGGGETIFVAVDTGLLVKEGDLVRVSTRRGVRGEGLATLQETVAAEFRQRDRRERQMQTALARMESSFFQQFIEMNE